MPFCPKCRCEFQDWVEVCIDCGIPLVKTLLEPETVPEPEPEVVKPTLSLVTVATFNYPLEAHLHRAKLESERIDSIVVDEHMVHANWLYNIAVGGVKLQVRESDAERALAILGEIPGHIPENPETSAEISDDERCPQCHSIDIHYETFHIRRLFALWFLLSFVSYLTLPFLKRKWKCNHCGYEWKERKSDDKR